jgi:hypothetical protein
MLCAQEILDVSAAKFLTSLVLCLGLAVCARAQAAPSNNSDESWVANSQSSRDNEIPSRTTESHTTFGNHRVDKQSMEVLGPDGEYQPYLEIEKETIEINATTTRTVVRTYSWDANRKRNLVQLAEEARTSASGDSQEIRTTSNPDVNGNLQIVRREVTGTTKTSPDSQQVQTTIYLADGNGGFTPSLQTRELLKLGTDHTVQVKKTILQPDADGNWKVSELREGTIKEEGTNRTTDERVSHADLDGKLSEVSSTVSKQTEDAAGEPSNTVDTYSVDAPGRTRDASLYLNSRVTTVQKKDSGGETTDEQVKEPDPGNPSDGLRVTEKTTDVARSGPSGTQQTKIFQVRDINGTYNVIAVQTRKTDQAPAAQAQAAPAASAKP